MTTSASSANATGSPDRRRFLSTIASVGAIGAPALFVFTATPGPIEAVTRQGRRSVAEVATQS